MTARRPSRAESPSPDSDDHLCRIHGYPRNGDTCCLVGDALARESRDTGTPTTRDPAVTQQPTLGSRPGPIQAPAARGRARNHHGHRLGLMNSTERAYAHLLDLRKAAGEVADWLFEQWKFVLVPGTGSDRVTWTPDFAVLLADGSIELVDVKGKQAPEDAQLVRAKALAASGWFTVVIEQQREDGGFNRRIIGGDTP